MSKYMYDFLLCYKKSFETKNVFRLDRNKKFLDIRNGINSQNNIKCKEKCEAQKSNNITLLHFEIVKIICYYVVLDSWLYTTSNPWITIDLEGLSSGLCMCEGRFRPNMIISNNYMVIVCNYLECWNLTPKLILINTNTGSRKIVALNNPYIPTLYCPQWVDIIGSKVFFCSIQEQHYILYDIKKDSKESYPIILNSDIDTLVFSPNVQLHEMLYHNNRLLITAKNTFYIGFNKEFREKICKIDSDEYEYTIYCFKTYEHENGMLKETELSREFFEKIDKSNIMSNNSFHRLEAKDLRFVIFKNYEVYVIFSYCDNIQIKKYNLDGKLIVKYGIQYRYSYKTLIEVMLKTKMFKYIEILLRAESFWAFVEKLQDLEIEPHSCYCFNEKGVFYYKNKKIFFREI